MLNTPILFLVFNRIDTTKQVFAKIREIQPKQLFVAADGAREEKEGEKEKCEEIRQFILDNIDWNCEVKTLFREKNLGCGVAVSEAITWFFDNAEQGIILEDDTLPNSSFFHFCEQMLDYYKNNDTIMHICGSNFQFGKIRGDASYYFSNYAPIWGWATWKNAWQKYQFDLQKISKEQLNSQFKIMFNKDEINFWTSLLLKMQGKDRIDTWDLQWAFSIWANEGVAITPNVNLVSNIGFGENATHTMDINSKSSNMKAQNMKLTEHPAQIKINIEGDKFIFYNAYSPEEKINPIRKFKNIILRILKKFSKD